MSVWMEWKQRNVNEVLSETRKDAGVNKTGVRFIAIVFPKSGQLSCKKVQRSENAVSDARCLLVADKDDAAEPEEESEPDSLSSVKSTVH